MIRRKTLAAAIGSAILLAAALAGGPLMAGDDVPFKAEMTATDQDFEPGEFPVLGTFTTTSEGTGTHIGKFTSVGVSTLVYTSAGIWFEGTATTVAADGDEIHSETWGFTWDPGDVEGYFEITGGTGRFDGATGSGTISATMGDDGVQTAVMEGRIDYKKN